MPGTTERQYHPLATAPGERAGWNPGMTCNQVDPRLLRSAMPRRIKEAGGHTFSIFPAKLAACDLIQLSLSGAADALQDRQWMMARVGSGSGLLESGVICYNRGGVVAIPRRQSQMS